MVEYGCQVTNKFGFGADDEFDDPSALLARAENAKTEKTPTQKKAEKKAEKLKKEQEEAQREAEAKKAAAAKVTGKENARPDGGRGRGRGGPRGAGGERRPPRENNGEGFQGENRPRGAPRGGRGGPRRGRGGAAEGGEHHKEVSFEEPKDGEIQGERPNFAARRGGFRRGGPDGEAREFETDRPPRPFTDRRGGVRGGRGRFGDRHSGSDRTGVKPVDAKNGHGKSNWGTEQDDIAVAVENSEEKPEEEKEPAPPREKTAEEIAREEEEARVAAYKTLSQYRAQLKADDAGFKVRQAGEGADEKGAFGKLVPMTKKEIQDEKNSTIEVVEVIKKEPRNKPIIVDFKFNEPNRGGFRSGDRDNNNRRGRGAPAAPRGRGGRGGGGSRAGETFRMAEDSFPALGSA